MKNYYVRESEGFANGYHESTWEYNKENVNAREIWRGVDNKDPRWDIQLNVIIFSSKRNIMLRAFYVNAGLFVDRWCQQKTPNLRVGLKSSSQFFFKFACWYRSAVS